MLKQASLRQLRLKSFAREKAYVALCMRHHPRGLKKEMRDEYLSALAPAPELFREWKALEKKVGHARAFAEVDYETRFNLSAEALRDLERLAKLSQERDVYLVCQCPAGYHCHREILLLLAKERWGTKIGLVFHSYPKLLERSGEIGKER